MLIGRVLLGVFALAIATAALKSSSPWMLGVAIVLLFFVVPGIAGSILGTLLNSKWGFLLLLLVVGFFAANQRSCSSSQLPLGDAGTLLDLTGATYAAESDYDKCLMGYVVAESTRSTQLDAEARQCVTSATAYVGSCLTQVQSQWWILDKGGYCRDQASRTVWRSCATTALEKYASDNGSVALASCQGKRTTTLMTSIAGMFSAMSSPTGSAAQTPTTAVAYDTGCLVKAHNDYLSYMKPDLDCNQYTSKVYAQGTVQTVANDLPKFQDCLVKTIIQGLGDAGARLVRSCQIPGR